MHWGCSSSAVTFSANFVMTVNLFVSDTKAKVYTIRLFVCFCCSCLLNTTGNILWEQLETCHGGNPELWHFEENKPLAPVTQYLQG